MNTQKYSEQFTQIPFGLYRDFELYSILQECLPIYTYLQTCIYRQVHGGDKFNLYEKYYINGILATSVAGSVIERMHGHGPNTVKDRLNLLEKHGFLKIKKIQTKYKNKGKWITGHQRVFILGTHIMGKPHYFARDVAFKDDTFDDGKKRMIRERRSTPSERDDIHLEKSSERDHYNRERNREEIEKTNTRLKKQAVWDRFFIKETDTEILKENGKIENRVLEDIFVKDKFEKAGC